MTVAALFPGQGSQHPDMLEPWLAHPASGAVIGEASDLLGFDVAARCAVPGALDRTELAQPALLVADVAAFRVLGSAGVELSAAAGHSLGEFAALVAAGALTFADALRLVSIRANAMAEASDARAGAMTALVGLSTEDAEEVCLVAGRGDILTVANENGPKVTVVSGSVAAVELAESLASTRGARAVRLRVAGAFHSPLMQPAVEPIRHALADTAFRAPKFPVISNVTGRPMTHPSAISQLLGRHVIAPVRWDASMRALAALGVHVAVEAGPGDTLTKLARRSVPDVRVLPIGSPEAALTFAEQLLEGRVA